MANSQHRCVFVGNIPYDVTEEQLVQICEEVGPVVSFRLVIDRETGKPKGYGFCEYKDEETALSARRNLNGYDINGRQLRVDFAENDKNSDKTREQGRGGPGLPTNIAPQRQIGGTTVQGDPSLHQPVGLQVAMTAAIVMSGTLGAGQTNSNISQPILGTDPLTLHLAKFTKAQLTDVLTEIKTMATQNKEQARQLLLAHPQLSKAVLQAHIMLKSVPPHMLQISNARQLPGQHTHPPVKVGQQPLPGLPPLAQNKVQPQSQPASLVPSQYVAPSLPIQPRFQTPLPPAQHQILQHSTLSGVQVAAGNLHSLNPQQTVENRMGTSSSMMQYPGQNAAIHPSFPTNKPNSLIGSSISNNGNKDHEKSQNLSVNSVWEHKVDNPPKLLKMENGRGASYSHADVNHSASISGSSPTVHLSGNQILKAAVIDSQKQNHEIPSGIESTLLQQVLSLTPEQLSSLPPEQQQQVIQLQQMLRKST